MCFKIVHSSPNKAKTRVRHYQVCYIHTTHLGDLKIQSSMSRFYPTCMGNETILNKFFNIFSNLFTIDSIFCTPFTIFSIYIILDTILYKIVLEKTSLDHTLQVRIFQGNLKGESVLAAILPSHVEVSYCTCGFFHS